MIKRIAYVDGLRAVAVLTVVIHHVAKYNSSLAAGPLQHGLLEGAHGVDLFFVISGFCLSYPVLASMRSSGSTAFEVAHYGARRLVRIIPPYYAAIAFCGLLLLLAGWYKLHLAPDMAGAHINVTEILKQMLFLDWRPQFVNGSFWSLAVEFRWYFLFPLLLALWVRSTRAFVLVAVAAFLAGNFTRAAGYDLAILPAFMLGIVAAELEVRCWSRTRLTALLFALALCMALVLEPRDNAEFFRQNQVAWQLAAFFFVVAAGCVAPLRAALSIRPLVAVGLASYSIYLVHEPIIGLIESNTSWGWALAFAAAVGCGFAFWFVFERPFVQTTLKRTFINYLIPPLERIAHAVGVAAIVSLPASAEHAAEKPSATATNDPERRLEEALH